MAYVLGLWRLASDLGVAGEFGIEGVFSHWQIWIGLAILLHLSASSLSRYGRGGDLNVPRILQFRSPETKPGSDLPPRKARAG